MACVGNGHGSRRAWVGGGDGGAVMVRERVMVVGGRNAYARGRG